MNVTRARARGRVRSGSPSATEDEDATSSDEGRGHLPSETTTAKDDLRGGSGVTGPPREAVREDDEDAEIAEALALVGRVLRDDDERARMRVMLAGFHVAHPRVTLVRQIAAWVEHVEHQAAPVYDAVAALGGWLARARDEPQPLGDLEARCSVAGCEARGFGALRRCLTHARCTSALCVAFGIVLVGGEPRCAEHDPTRVTATASATAEVVSITVTRRSPVSADPCRCGDPLLLHRGRRDVRVLDGSAREGTCARCACDAYAPRSEVVA